MENSWGLALHSWAKLPEESSGEVIGENAAQLQHKTSALWWCHLGIIPKEKQGKMSIFRSAAQVGLLSQGWARKEVDLLPVVALRRANESHRSALPRTSWTCQLLYQGEADSKSRDKRQTGWFRWCRSTGRVSPSCLIRPFFMLFLCS